MAYTPLPVVQLLDRRATADPPTSDDDGEEEAMDHSESGALEAARARRGDLHRALLDLEQALAGAARGRAQAWADSVRATLVRVREAFTAHVDVTEGTDGLYQEVRAQAPRLSGAVDRLQHEHAEIANALAEVDNRLDDSMSDADGWVESIRDAAITLMGLLVRHRQRGADLVYEAYDVEIGGET
jgi:Hemerythrin HHE cation binding domain